MSTTVNEAFKTETSVTEKLASGNSTITQTLSGDAWTAQGGADQFYGVTLENPNSNPGNTDVSQQIQFTTSISDLNYFGVTAGSYTTVDGATMPASSQRIKFSGTFQSTTQGIQSPNNSTIDSTNTYHYLDGTTYSHPTYTTITVNSQYIWAADGTDEFATDFDFRCRVGAIENTSSNVWSTAFLIGPRLVGTITDYWEGSRFIIDGLDGDTAPTIAVESQIQEQSVNAKIASCTMSAEFASTQTAKNLVGFPGVSVGRYAELDYFTTENNYIELDYVEVGYVDSINYMEIGEGVAIPGMEQILESDFQQPVTLAGLSIQMDALTLQSQCAIATTPGYLISADSTVAANTAQSALGGIIIDSVPQSLQTDSQVQALGGIIIDNSATVQSESQFTALGGLTVGIGASILSDSFATIQARANLVGEIELVSQFGFNFLEGTRLSGEATLTTATNLASTTRVDVLPGLVNLQTESTQSQIVTLTYQISESLLAEFNIEAIEITDIVLGSATLNAGSFQLTSGRNWLIDRYYTLIVEDENRDFQVLPETRIQVVQDENRDYYIKTENRAIKVEQETRVRPDPIGQGLITPRRTERV